MKILFQGDSITDAGRDRSNKEDMGQGYPKYAAAYIAARHPNVDFTFYNQGISGDRAESLRARWQSDCIDLQPDLVSILIGVNDQTHILRSAIGTVWKKSRPKRMRKSS